MMDLFALLELYNTFDHDNIDFDIVRKLLENYTTLELRSARQLADSLHVSQSSLNRFWKRLYYENFSLYRDEHAKWREYYFFDYDYVGHGRIREAGSFREHMDCLTREFQGAAADMDEGQLGRLLESLLAHDEIIFVGTPLGGNIWRLQMELVLLGKRTSAFLTPDYQIEAVRSAGPGTLVVGLDLMRQDDVFLPGILAEAGRAGAERWCISHLKKRSCAAVVREQISLSGSNAYTDQLMLSILVSYLGSKLRQRVLER